MPFLRGFAYQVTIVLILHVYFLNIVLSEDCERAFRQVLVKYECGKPCVYVEKSGLKYIGWKFALEQGQLARPVFTSLGADYEQFCKGPVTSSDARCECNNVPCLNKRQMDKLLNQTVEGAVQDTLTLFPSLKNLCCSLQSSILLLAFTSRGKIFSDFAALDIEYHIKMQIWLALSQRLNQTEWCRNYQEVCTEQTRRIVHGCVDRRGRLGNRDKRGINLKSKDHAICAENTCHIEGSHASVLKPSTTVGIIRSTAWNKRTDLVKPSIARHIPSGTASAATAPINTADTNGDSQFLLRPSHVQMSDVTKMTSVSIRGSPLTADFLKVLVSSASTKSLGKDAPLRLTSTLSLAAYLYNASTISAKTSPELHLVHGLTTQSWTSEFRYGTSSTDWFRLTPSSKYMTETAKPSAVILSYALKLWSLSVSESERMSLISSGPLQQTSFHSAESLSTISASKTPPSPKLPLDTSLGQVLRTKTMIKFEGSLFSGTSTSKTSRISKTRLSSPLEPAIIVSSASWPPQKIPLHPTNPVVKTLRLMSSVMEPKSQSAMSALRATTSLERPLDQVLRTSSSLRRRYSVSSATSALRTPNSYDLSFGTSLTPVVQGPTRFPEFYSPTTAVIHEIFLKSSTIKQTLYLVSLQSSLASGMLHYRLSSSTSWSTHAQQKSELSGSPRLTMGSEMAVTQSIRSSPALPTSSYGLVLDEPSQIPQKLSSATHEVSSRLRVPSVVLDSTKSLRISSIFASSIHSQVSRTLKTLSNMMSFSRPQTVKPQRRSYSLAINTLFNHSSLRTSFPEQTMQVHKMSSMPSTSVRESLLLFLHTAASVSSSAWRVLYVTTKQMQSRTPLTTSQTRDVLSSVLGARTVDVLSTRTSNALSWSSSMLRLSSAVPLPSPSPSLALLLSSSSTTIKKTVTNARPDSLDNKTSATFSFVSAIGIRPSSTMLSFSSVKKANSTTISGISLTTRGTYRSSQGTSSLGLTLGIPLQASSQSLASALRHPSTPTWTKMSVAVTRSLAKKQTGTPVISSYDLVSAALILSSSTSTKLSFSKSSSLHSRLIAVVVPTPSLFSSFSPSKLAPRSSVPGLSQYDQTYLIIFSGNCAMLKSKEDFSSLFKVVFTRLLSVRTTDISALRITCGSIHVMFSIRGAKRRNITNRLRDLVEGKAFKIEYNNLTFIALNMSVISKPSRGTTARPSRTTHTSMTSETRKTALIIFILVLSFFAAVAALLAMIFCARFCRCCRKREKRRKPKKTSVEVELQVFKSLHNNPFPKVDYYGGSRQPPTPSKVKQEAFECEDVEGQPVSTVTALLSETEKAGDEEKKFTFDDDDSCASALFY